MIFRALSTLIKRQARVYSLSFYHFSSQSEQVEACKNEQKHAFFDPSWSFEEFKHKNQMFYKQKQNSSPKQSQRERYFYDWTKWQLQQHLDPSKDWRNLKLEQIEKSEQFKILDDKTIYKGQFYEGKPHGLGINIKFSGQCYKGEWVNGQRQGNGKQICQKGVYEGTFKNNLKHGVGDFHFARDGTYSGEWENGKENGVGRRLFFHGQHYYGYFKNGTREGIGRYYFWEQINSQLSQLDQLGVWKNGKLVDIIRQTYSYGQHQGHDHQWLTKKQLFRYYPENPEYQEQIQRLKHKIKDLDCEEFNTEQVDKYQKVLSDEEVKLRKGNVDQSQFF